ncbi:MAG TPA: hypothetical protein VF628_11220 [Allosphingosinicella sp.]
MTKVRPPLTFELALTRVAGLLGWDRSAEILGVAERTVRDWSDPDTVPLAGRALCVEDCIHLDVAYRAAGGDGAPLLSCYALLFETELTTSADNGALVRHIARAAKETGEALAASVLASAPGATAADRELARREGEEAIGCITNIVTILGAAPTGERQ